MSKFRKKPVVIDAVQWLAFGDDPEVQQRKLTEWQQQHAECCVDDKCRECGGSIDQAHGWIGTLEGGHRVCPGDWIITGVKGERYPIKPDHLRERPTSQRETPMASPSAPSPPNVVSVAPHICKGRDNTAADHCWHFSRNGSGSVSSDGSGHTAGKRRCCFCGFTEYWEQRWGARIQVEHDPHEPKPYEQF